MSSDDQPAGKASVQEVVRKVSYELSELLEQREEITSRIRELRRVVEALQMFELLMAGAAQADLTTGKSRKESQELQQGVGPPQSSS